MSSFAVQSSLPLFESTARKRLSFVAAIKTSPPAVAIGPPMFRRPVFFFPSGNSSVTPSGTFQAISPVLAFTATRLPHGGFWHGQACAPELLMLPDRGSPSLNWNRDVGPTMLFRRYPFPRCPSGVFSIQPMLASSCVLTKTYPSVGSDAVPPQFTPPIEPGKRTVEIGFAPSSRYRYGVNGPTLYRPPLRSASSRQNFACSSLVSAAVTMSSAL